MPIASPETYAEMLDVAKRDALIRNLHVQMDKQINGLLSDFRTKAGAYLLSMKFNGSGNLTASAPTSGRPVC